MTHPHAPSGPGTSRSPASVLPALALVVLATLALPFVSAPAHVAAQEAGPRVTVAPSSGLDPEGQTVTITGQGFGGATDGVYVRLCAAADGAIGTAEGRPNADRCLGDPQHWVSNSPGATAPMGIDGSFLVTLEIVGTFTGGDGDAFDCRVDACGIATRRDHIGGASDFSLDTFTAVAFTGDPDPDPDPDPGDGGEPEPTPVDGDAALHWGVKASFRHYVENGPAAGEITTTDPATRNEDGTFRFSATDTYELVAIDDVSASYAGTVRFTGHDGALDLTITDPRIDLDGSDGVLVVDAESKDLETGQTTTYDDVEFATLDGSDPDVTSDEDAVTWHELPAALTEDGAAAFAGFYDEGEELDPVTFTVPGEVDGADDGSNGPGDGEGGDVSDLVTCVPSALDAGQAATACGEGFTAGEQVQAFLHSDPVFLALGVAGDDGSVEVPFTVPADVGGEHRIELRGVTSGRSIFSNAVTVRAAQVTTTTTTSVTATTTAASGTLPATGAGSSRWGVVGALLIFAGSSAVVSARILRRAGYSPIS